MNALFEMFDYISSQNDMFVQASDYLYSVCTKQK